MNYEQKSMAKLFTIGSFWATSLCAQNTLVTIAEDSAQTTSSLNNTDVFTFNDLPLGLSSDVMWEGVGQFDSLYVANANVYGGAYDESTGKASKFSWQGSRWTPASTLYLDEPSSYFGFWWSAGDPNNLLTFYDQDTIIAQYTTASMFGRLDLPSEYYGNPLSGGNGNEPYAFINFYGSPDTQWDSIVLTQTTGGGFESDNYTSRVEGFNPSTDNIEDIGQVVATVSGTNTSVISEPSQVSFLYTEDGGANDNWVWDVEEASPGAPTPPIYALLFFALAYTLKDYLQQSGRKNLPPDVRKIHDI